MTIHAPDLEDDGGTIRSRQFGDIYFSPEDGAAETTHVFVDGNDLAARFAGCCGSFVVAELGFGTGLNLIAAWEAFEASGSRSTLDFWSCEGYPLDRRTMQTVLARIGERWPNLAPYAERLASAYPEPRPGTVRIDLDERVTLTIAFGEALPALKASTFQADAWFLDGFAPSRNPDMWSLEVLSEVARLTRAGGTAATFSVASMVRANIEQAGFAWTKAPGYGRKKHMLRAEMNGRHAASEEAPWFRPPAPSGDGPVAIIGAGIAAANLFRSLTRSGLAVDVVDGSGPAAGASGNPAGLIMPRLDADDGAVATFYRDAFMRALDVYGSLGDDAFNVCGGSMKMDGEKAEKVIGNGLWPGVALSIQGEAVHIPAAGVLAPSHAVRAMLPEDCVRNFAVLNIEDDEKGWWLIGADTIRLGPYAAVVVAAGADSSKLLAGIPLKPSLGQVDWFGGPAPDQVWTDGTYVAPFGGGLMTGATYAVFDGGNVATTQAATGENRAAATALLGAAPTDHRGARAALRATTPDRHPIAGPIAADEAASLYAGLAKGLKTDYPPAPYQEGLYALTGLGSRGLVTAPILAEHIAASITGGVSPLGRDAAHLVHPGRFLIRALKRGEALTG